LTYEEKKDWLRQYERAKKKELHLTHELQEAECDYGHMTQALSSVPGGSGDGQALPRAVERVEKAKQALDATISMPKSRQCFSAWKTPTITRF
jgi:hypothetical protein